MITTPMSLLEYSELVSNRAKKAGYKWLLMFIGRKADAEKIYDTIERTWSSLNDLTNDRMAFVFSMALKMREKSIYHTRRRESSFGKVCPFGCVVGEDPFCDSIGDFDTSHSRSKGVDWKDLHTQSITEFARAKGIKERDIPGLYVYSLELKEYRYIPLSDGTDIYLLIKNIVSITADIDGILESMDSSFVDSKLFYLEKGLRDHTKTFDGFKCKIIIKILDGQADYRENKESIPNERIRDNIKRVGQWKRQRGLPNYDYYSDEAVFNAKMAEAIALFDSIKDEKLGKSAYNINRATLLSSSL